MTLTKDRMRADIAQIAGLQLDEVTDRDDLRDLGVDSMQTMDLASLWEEQVAGLDYTELFDGTTLDDWWAVVDRLQGA
ncbi:phosphopantetheine-binding protein [Oceanicola sp. S124]|uniref:phosphopantetheine-binding protein n=1 Tax=Oceanicola sp. S124 TaxID=1042378 RepID=UPI0002559017|nr:phosphopantetheine-binding protein [Oceanicola sp. S124]